MAVTALVGCAVAEPDPSPARVAPTTSAWPALPRPGDLQTLLIRTDFSDDAAWDELVQRVNRGKHGTFTVVDDPGFGGFEPADVLDLPRSRSVIEVFLADGESMTNQTLAVVAVHRLTKRRGESFRVTARMAGSVQANLSIANLLFEEYQDIAGRDGLISSHRG